MAIIKKAESGISVQDLCREHGMSCAVFYQWRAKFSDMDASMIKRLKELEAENARLNRMYAEEKLQADIANEALQKSGKAILTQRDDKVLH